MSWWSLTTRTTPSSYSSCKESRRATNSAGSSHGKPSNTWLPTTQLFPSGSGSSQREVLHLEPQRRKKASSFLSFFFHLMLFFLPFLGEEFPPALTVPLTRISTLRYGENPHQKASVYADDSLSVVNAGGIATAVQHHGKVSLLRSSGPSILHAGTLSSDLPFLMDSHSA